MGPRTEEFEQRFAEDLGSGHVLALSSCTAALHVACIAAGVGPGDEVIVPSMTFAATANAVRYCGARPVFADLVGLDDLGMDVAHAESLISARTKAVIPVHYAGYPVDIHRLVELCEARGIAVIEDSAHAPRASLDGRRLGTFGMAGCYSFFPNKVLGVGEGGALATDSDEVAERVRRLRSQGMTASTRDRHLGRAMDYDVVELGFNYRFDDSRAALLLSRFARLEAEIERRRQIIRRYHELLGGAPGITLAYAPERVEQSSCYLMGVLVDDAGLRSAVRGRLMEEHGVQTTVYPAVHRLQAYRDAYGEPPALPKTERVADSLFSIPLFPHLTDAQQDHVAAAVRESVETLSDAGAQA